MKKIMIIFLVIVGIYILFTAFTNSSIFPFSKKNTQTEVTTKIKQIELDVSGAELTIIPDKRDTIEAKLNGKGSVSVKKSGDTIEVDYKRKSFNWVPFFNTAKIAVYIPEDYNKDLSISVGSGVVNFTGQSSSQPFVLNELELTIGSGNMNISNLSVNDLSYDVSSGNVHVDSVIAKTGSFEISSGNVKVNNYQGGLDIDLSSGKIDVQLDQLTGNIDIDVSSGNAVLNLPNNADFTLKGKASSGNISNSFPLTNEKQEKNKLEGVHGSGTFMIDVTMSSGNVTIQ